MDKFSAIAADFARDSAKESEGAWFTIKHMQYKLARAHRNNPAFTASVEKDLRPYQGLVERSATNASLRGVTQQIMQAIYSATVFLAIRPVPTPDVLEPEVIDTTPNERAKLLADYPDLWDEIFRISNTGDNYTPDQIADDSKN